MTKFYSLIFTAKYVRSALLTSSAILLFFFSQAQVKNYVGATGANWGHGPNWDPVGVPTSADDVIIPNNKSVLVNVIAQAKSVTIEGGNVVSGITIAGSNSLTVAEGIIINSGTGAGDDKFIDVAAGSLVAGSVSMAAVPGAADDRANYISISTGSVTINGDITMDDADPDRNYIQVGSGGTINLAGAISGGDLVADENSVFNYNGSVAQSIATNGYEYGNLQLNNTSAGGVSLSGDLSAATILGNLEIQTGIFNNGGNAISLASGKDFILLDGATFNLTATSAMPTVSGGGAISLAPAGLVRFQGTDQDIPPLTYGDLSISGSGTKTLQGSVTVEGDFSMTSSTLETTFESGGNYTITLLGNFSHTGGTITESSTSFAGTFLFDGGKLHTYTSGGTISNSNNIVVSSGDTLQAVASTTQIQGETFNLQSGATLGIKALDGIATSGSTGQVRASSTRTYATGASYIYNGIPDQIAGNGLTQGTPLNLTINNPGNTVSLSAPTAISGDLLILAGSLSAVNGVDEYDISIGGNWTNNGTGFVPGTATTTFTGTGVSTIGGAIATTFNSLSLNKSVGGSGLLGQNINVNGTLSLGVNLDIADNILTLGIASPEIASIGGGFTAAKMIVASEGGEVRKSANSEATASYLFPVGDNTGTAEYSPAAITFTGGTYSGYVGVSVTDAKHPENGNTTSYITRYWTVTQSAFSGFSAFVDFTYVDADVEGAETFVRLGKWDGAEPWIRFTSSVNEATNQLFATVTSFSDFTGINLQEALPVKLSNFEATLVEKHTELTWATSEEINSAYFDVEHSTDGEYFTKLSTVASKNSQVGSSYSYKHINPATGQNYYRLKMVDIDAKFEYSPIVTLKYAGTQKQLNAYPNPATSDVTIQFEKASKGAFLRVIDMQGKVVQSVAVPVGATLMQVKLNRVTRGMYNIIYENNGEKTIHRIQKN